MTGVLARIAAGRRRAVLVLASGDQGLLWVPLARSSGGVLGGVLATERWATGVWIGLADLGGPDPPPAACLGGSLALLLAWVALWVHPTERGALAHGGGDAALGTLATWARAIRGG